ncbi:TPA: hypothetical protein I7709_21700, partial [Vibrio vulnificus]|nr:hypothetical protein [Vibrio vulnificus]HAS8165268.1 hypothetical protein [Vibrio vulnificus]
FGDRMAKNSRELNQNLNDLARKALDGDLVARDLLLQSLKSTKSVRRFIAQFEEENSGWSATNNPAARSGKYYQSTIVALSGKTSARPWKKTK